MRLLVRAIFSALNFADLEVYVVKLRRVSIPRAKHRGIDLTRGGLASVALPADNLGQISGFELA